MQSISHFNPIPSVRIFSWLEDPNSLLLFGLIEHSFKLVHASVASLLEIKRQRDYIGQSFTREFVIF
jgi:hypothetical protein